MSGVPPLVAPGPPLTPGERARYARHLLLPDVGELGQRRLRAARICVVGAGGLGAPVLLYLAAAGVGRLGIVDDDVVDVTNLQRQVVHGADDVGRRKTASAADAVRRVSPETEVVEHRCRLTAENADLLADYDLVIDGTDNFPTRYAVNDACVRLGLPEVWGSVFRFDAQVSVFWGRPPAGVPPVQLRDLFPSPPPPGSVPSCAVGGVLGAMCGQVGSLMAAEAVKLVVGAGEPLLGRVAVLDALSARWAEVPLRGAAGPTAQAPPVAPGGRSAAPDAVPAVREVRARELAELLAADAVTLLDVREPFERAIAAIPGGLAVPLDQLPARLGEVPGDRPVVVYCHSGVRSAAAAGLLAGAGHDAASLAGGILAWSADVDPTTPRY